MLEPDSTARWERSWIGYGTAHTSDRRGDGVGWHEVAPLIDRPAHRSHRVDDGVRRCDVVVEGAQLGGHRPPSYLRALVGRVSPGRVPAPKRRHEAFRLGE